MGPEISLLLSRRGKFHLDLLISHSMLRHTPKDYFYDYPVTEQRLVIPKYTTTHGEKNDDLRSKDLAGVPLEINRWHIQK
jgi:hypothetical protein